MDFCETLTQSFDIYVLLLKKLEEIYSQRKFNSLFTISNFQSSCATFDELYIVQIKWLAIFTACFRMHCLLYTLQEIHSFHTHTHTHPPSHKHTSVVWLFSMAYHWLSGRTYICRSRPHIGGWECKRRTAARPNPKVPGDRCRKLVTVLCKREVTKTWCMMKSPAPRLSAAATVGAWTLPGVDLCIIASWESRECTRCVQHWICLQVISLAIVVCPCGFSNWA